MVGSRAAQPRPRLQRLTDQQGALRAAARIVVAILVYQVLLIGVSIALYLVGSNLVQATEVETFGVLALGAAEGAAMIGVLLVWRTVDRRALRELGLEWRWAGPRWLRGAGVAGLMMGFIVLVWYTVLDAATWTINSDPRRAALVVVVGLLGFSIQGPAEEVLFRGHLLENVAQRWGPRWAVAVSSLAFGLFHAANPSFGLLPFANLVLFGVAAALYKMLVDHGQLWGVFGIHTIWNWLQQVVFGLPNSGIASSPANALFTVSTDPSLPSAIWGGGFGPEGTLACTLVLLMLIGMCLRRRRTTLPRA